MIDFEVPGQGKNGHRIESITIPSGSTVQPFVARCSCGNWADEIKQGSEQYLRESVERWEVHAEGTVNA